MKLKKAVIPLLLCIFLCGCQSYSEIEDALMVSGIAVDKGVNDNYRVTAELVNLSVGEGEPPSAQLIYSEGPTVYSALQNMNSLTSKELFFSQAKVFVISEQVAREGLINVIDLIVRDNQLRITNDVVVAKDCPAYALFTLADSGEPIRSYEIAELLQNESENVSVVSEVQVYELINIVGSAGVSAVLPAFSYLESEEDKGLKISGAAVFRRDKLVEFLDITQAKIMTLVQGETREGIISEKIKTDTQEYMTVKIFKCLTDADHELKDDKLIMKMNFSLDVGINELTTKENIMNREGREKLMKKLEKRLKTQVENFIKEMQQGSGADIFGFGERIYKENPKLWEKIKDTDYFRNLQPQIKVKVNLRGTGFVAKSPSAEDFRLKEG